jgi:hypothetical protein
VKNEPDDRLGEPRDHVTSAEDVQGNLQDVMLGLSKGIVDQVVGRRSRNGNGMFKEDKAESWAIGGRDLGRDNRLCNEKGCRKSRQCPRYRLGQSTSRTKRHLTLIWGHLVYTHLLLFHPIEARSLKVELKLTHVRFSTPRVLLKSCRLPF